MHASVACVVARSRPRFRSASSLSRFLARAASSSPRGSKGGGGGGGGGSARVVPGASSSLRVASRTSTTPSASRAPPERSSARASASFRAFANDETVRSEPKAVSSSARARSATPRFFGNVSKKRSARSARRASRESAGATVFAAPTRLEKARRNSSVSNPDPHASRARRAIVSLRRRFVSRVSRSDAVNDANVSSPTPSIASARRPPRETSPSREPRTTSFGLRRKVRSVSRARDAPRSRPCGAEGCSRRPRAGASRARRRAHRRSTRSLRGNRARRLSRTKRGSRGSRGSPTRRAARDLPRGGTRGPPRVGSSGPSDASRAESRASRESGERCHATSSVAGQGRGGHRGEPRRSTATATGAGLPLRHRPGVVPAGSGSDCGSSSCRGAAHGAGTRGRARRPTSTARRRTTRRRARVSKCRRARRRWDDSDGRATGRVRLFRASARDRDGARVSGRDWVPRVPRRTSRLSRDEYRHATRGTFTILSSPLSSMRSSPSPPRRACSP